MIVYKFKSIRWIDGKKRNVIVDICRNIINRDPTKEELKCTRPELSRKEIYNNEEYYKEFLRCKRECLLGILRKFERDEGRSPIENDFIGNPKYPSYSMYVKMFGTWNSALDMAGLTVNYITNATNEELLGCLIQFYDKEGRIPTENDLKHNPKYPSYIVYCRRFGSWQSTLKLLGLDTDSMSRKGIIETKNQKARLAEICVLRHFTEKAQDLSGENYTNHPYDGICPKNQTYDVKSSKLYNGKYYNFDLRNVHRDEIEWYFLLGFNEDYTKLERTWRIPALDFIDKDYILIGIVGGHTYNLENMKEYEITEKIKYI